MKTGNNNKIVGVPIDPTNRKLIYYMKPEEKIIINLEGKELVLDAARVTELIEKDN